MNELLENLHVDQLEELYDILINKIDIKSKEIKSNHLIINRETNNISCERCGSYHILKNGKTKQGVQKYICKDCKKTLSNTTGKIIHYSKHAYSKWRDFVECTLNQLSLKKIVEKLDISKTTAFYWRQKLHKAISKYIKMCSLSGEVQSDATYVDINLKGTKTKNMPRKSKIRPKANFKGISKEKVCIVSAIDENDNMVFQIAGVGRESIKHYGVIKHHFANVDLLITDQAWGYTSFAKQLNCKLIQIPHTSYVTDDGYSIASLNETHSKLKTFLKKYQGVSIRHLQGYLDLYVLIRKHKYIYKYKENIKQTFKTMICADETIKNIEICKKAIPIDLSIAFG